MNLIKKRTTVKITVLVAVYNAESFLEQCLESLLNQTLKEIQIICINDGSTDKSADILALYKEKDSRLFVVNQDNKGASAARNLGLTHATGEYICYVDSDDWIEHDSLEKLYKKIEQSTCDGIFFDVYYFYGDKNEFLRKKVPSFECISGREAFEYSLFWQVPGIVLWRSIVVKSIGYDEGGIHGDEYSSRCFFISSKSLLKGDGIYFYRQYASSITKKKSYKRVDCLLTEIRVLKLAELNDLNKTIIEQFSYYIFRNMKKYMSDYFHNENNYTMEEKEYVIGTIKNVFYELQLRRKDIKNKNLVFNLYNEMLFSSFGFFYSIFYIINLLKKLKNASQKCFVNCGIFCQ